MRTGLKKNHAVIKAMPWSKNEDGSEYVLIKEGVLTLRTITAKQLESMATFVMRFDYTQTRKRFSGADIMQIKKEALEWAMQYINENNIPGAI
ncbi:hypothetical protein [Shewanella sp. M-Br]|uniref:hypothetical protein n=1 Tax=Shewanella sp. M-Br TaxID=2495595 RepID=UPI00294A3D9D|nr:hypothetical protein SMBr_28250 [Shewanella sp. M-Br]